MRAKLAGAIVIALLVLSSCSPSPGYKRDEHSWWPFANVWNPGATDPQHPHIHAASQEGIWSPDAGYLFVDKDKSKDVQWTPGLPHPDNQHVISAAEEGKWAPAPGYDWVNPNDIASLNVRWVVGKEHPDFPHILSAPTEGYWSADPGYDWVDPAKSLSVAWKPYLAYANHPHIFSYDKEGYWLAMPGYKFYDTGLEIAPPGAGLDVTWNVGVTHPSCEWLTAAPEEGIWHLDDNFVFTSTDPSHLVFHRTEESAQNRKYSRIAFDVFVWLVGSAVGQSSDNDSSTTSALKYGARAIGDHAAVDGLTTAFSDPGAEEHVCDIHSTQWTRGFTGSV
ncbi:MAG TPA: hypothetical protein VFW19_09620 [Allosphingosinicella sp.]|nr:hypothetical protein [Allosphingosinicella sp.]